MICRRTFVKGAVAGAGGVAAAGTWLSLSESRAARLGRRLIDDAKRGVAAAPLKPEPAKWDDKKITMAWLGHSSVLINFYGMFILTDPVLGNRVGISTPFGTMGIKRLVAPGLTARELPPIDAVVLSHAHYDHLDTATLSKLGAETWVATAAVTKDVVGPYFKNVNELKWGETATLKSSKGDLTVEAIEVKHWGERWPSKLERGYNGYVLRREGKALLFGGDTALTPTVGEAKARGPFEAAIMPIGAYRPWVWNHCDPEQALEMANAAGAKYIAPVHHQTFKLSEEPLLEPIQRLQAALQREPERVAWTQIGQTFVVPIS